MWLCSMAVIFAIRRELAKVHVGGSSSAGTTCVPNSCIHKLFSTQIFNNFSSLTNLLIILSFKSIPSDSKIAIFSIKLLLILWKTTFFFIFTNPLWKCNYQSLLFVFNLKSLLYSNLGALAVCSIALCCSVIS